MGVPPDQPPLPSFHNSSAVVPKGPIPVPVPLTLWPVAIESSSHSAMYPLWSVCCCPNVQSRLGFPLACESVSTFHVLARELCAHVPCCVPHNHVLCFPGCPCGLGPRPCSLGPVPARCLPPWAVGSSVPAYHSCLWALAWPHRIPGATCPLLLPPLALTGPWALPSPGTGWHLPLSGPPSQGRINRILSQSPFPVWADL